MNVVPLPWFTEILQAVLEHRELSAQQVGQIFDAMLRGELGEAETSAFLIGMRMKGETARELAAAARQLRQHMHRLDAGRRDLLDTCGTGGDGSGTFNISTAAALIAAGAGVPVVKHGNRAVSSRSGSADVLAELGLAIDAGSLWAKRCLDQAGLAFCFAPQFHPGLKHVGPLRRRLGTRTMLNLLGPLANPAEAPFQLLGVGRPELLDPVAGALALLGVRQAFVVCGSDGLDEVSLSGPTLVRHVSEGNVKAHEWTPAEFGLEPCTLMELKADTPRASAQIICGVLAGQAGPAARIAVANAAAALVAAGRADSLRDGVAQAVTAIRSGRAAQVLETMRTITLPC